MFGDRSCRDVVVLVFTAVQLTSEFLDLFDDRSWRGVVVWVFTAVSLTSMLSSRRSAALQWNHSRETTTDPDEEVDWLKGGGGHQTEDKHTAQENKFDSLVAVPSLL